MMGNPVSNASNTVFEILHLSAETASDIEVPLTLQNVKANRFRWWRFRDSTKYGAAFIWRVRAAVNLKRACVVTRLPSAGRFDRQRLIAID